METNKKLEAYLKYLGIAEQERGLNVGKSDYSKHFIQPWTIWDSYPDMNPKDADIIKRVLRKKAESGVSPIQSRIMDYDKIIHICRERARQLRILKDLDEDMPLPVGDKNLLKEQREYENNKKDNDND